MQTIKNTLDTEKTEEIVQKRPYDPPRLIQIDEKHEAPYSGAGASYDGGLGGS